jgi:hypothetical protein
VPAAIDAVAGVIAIETRDAGVTVRVTPEDVIPFMLAVIVEVPAAKPVATPAELIVAVEMFEEFHVTADERSWVVWLEKTPVAVKSCVFPVAIEATEGVTEIDTSGAGVTVKIAVLLVALPPELLTTTENCELLSAVMVAGVV